MHMPRITRKVDPAGSVAAFKQRLAATFPGLPADGHRILCGFPPKALAVAAGEEDSVSIRAAGLENCGTVQVHLCSASGVVTQAPPKRTKKRSAAAATSGTQAGEGAAHDRVRPEEVEAWEDRMGTGLIAATDPLASEVNDSIRQFRRTLANELRIRQEERLASQRLEAAFSGASASNGYLLLSYAQTSPNSVFR